MASTATTAAPRRGARVRVQQFGTFLSNMVLPNIGAFIAWGLITALFIEVGWITLIGDKIFDYHGGYGFVEELGGWGSGADGTGIVGPMITYLLPILIGYTGGRMAYGEDNIRGGVVGAIATMGAVTGADVPMFLGAMIMGPLGGYTMRKIDALWDGKIKPGFEMLVNNFSAGIWGMCPGDRRVPRGRTVRRGLLRPGRERRRLPGRQQPAPADLDLRRAGQDPLPQQRHQPRRLHPARDHRGGRAGQVAPVPDRGQPRSRSRTAARLHASSARGSRRRRRPALP